MSSSYDNFPGVRTTVSSVSSPIEQVGTKTITLWGHSIDLTDNSIKCKACKQEEEVEELLQQSTGFREVVYKLYVLGKFREKKCMPHEEEIEDTGMNSGTNPIINPSSRHQVDPDRVYWSGNSKELREKRNQLL